MLTLYNSIETTQLIANTFDMKKSKLTRQKKVKNL